jgi:hypothetical protein
LVNAEGCADRVLGTSHSGHLRGGGTSESSAMSARDRRTIRYLAAAVAVIAGALFAAAVTNSVGNTVATVLIGGGLLAFVIMLLRDMGLIEVGERTPPPAAGPSSSGGDPHRGDGPDLDPANGAGPDPGERRSVNVPRPERLRGQRRRLR